MAGRAKKEPKEKKKTLIDFNQGFKLREIKVGQRVDVYKIPYKQKGKTYTGTILDIVHRGTLGAWCKLRRIDTGAETIDFIYLGKIYDGWDKPFS